MSKSPFDFISPTKVFNALIKTEPLFAFFLTDSLRDHAEHEQAIFLIMKSGDLSMMKQKKYWKSEPDFPLLKRSMPLLVDGYCNYLNGFDEEWLLKKYTTIEPWKTNYKTFLALGRFKFLKHIKQEEIPHFIKTT
jgi:hypothetical protein